MREIHVSKITETVKQLCMDSNYYLGEDIKNKFYEFKEKETSKLGKKNIRYINQKQ
ncbi:hypothetical protein TCEA9_22690 [Thermobrachium celere]|nr:hypothetical protein TCEA9_22690 [Thermobrachium celere]